MCSRSGRLVWFLAIFVGLVPFESEDSFISNEADEKINKIFNYLLYMKNYLLKEGYYFSYDYDLTLSREAYS